MDHPQAHSKSTWHLGQTEKELAFAEFQHSMICLGEAFYRYVGKAMSMIAGEANLTGQDCVILNVIQTQNRPKGITEIQHFTNRTDIANIQYSVRKLIKAGLIEKVPREQGRGTTYRVSDKGSAVVSEFLHARTELLNQFPEEERRLIERLESGKSLMVMLTGLYDQASRNLTTVA